MKCKSKPVMHYFTPSRMDIIKKTVSSGVDVEKEEP
jgi:hypothetical protein